MSMRLIGLDMALNNPPWVVSINDMVPPEELPAAASMIAPGLTVTRSVGGAVVACFPSPKDIATDAVGRVANVVAIRWRRAPGM